MSLWAWLCTVASGAADWAKNAKDVVSALSGIREYFRRAAPKVLILGPGGVGKTTLAQLLVDEPTAGGHYEESLGTETHENTKIFAGAITVLPGQRHRRDSVWTPHLRDITNGKYDGVIIVGSYGYHAVSIDVRQLLGDDLASLEDFFDKQRKDELSVVELITTAVTNRIKPIWCLVLVTKEDLWYSRRDDVRQWLDSTAFKRLRKAVSSITGSRYETCLTCLEISNIATERGDVLASHDVAYDERSRTKAAGRMADMIVALLKHGAQHGK